MVREIAHHRGGGVQDDEDVHAPAEAQQLAVVRQGRRRVQDQQENRDRDAVARNPRQDPPALPKRNVSVFQNGNLAGSGPTSTSATSALEYCAKAWSLDALRNS